MFVPSIVVILVFESHGSLLDHMAVFEFKPLGNEGEWTRA